MPIYEYTCTECHTRFEKIRSFSQADQEIACQYCGSLHTNRALSRFFTHSGNGSVETNTNSSGCSSCNSGNCSNCHH